jgi:hypothetical protein
MTLEAILWLGVPLAASIAVSLVGPRARLRGVRVMLVSIGVVGVALSIAWILLALRIEAVVK